MQAANAWDAYHMSNLVANAAAAMQNAPVPLQAPQVMTPEVEKEVKELLTEANMLRSRNKLRDAIQIYDRVLALDAYCMEAHNSKGVCFKQLGDNASALVCYNRAVAQKPEDWRAHNNRGVIFKETGLFEQAIEAYAVAISAFRKERASGATPAMATSDVVMNSDDNEQKEEPHCVAEDNMAIVLTDFGTRLKVAGNVDAAVARYNEAIRYNPKYSPAYFNLGVVYSESGQFQKALKFYEMAIERNSQYVEAVCNIGVIYKNGGALEKAIEYYERALQINANFTIANTNLAIAYTDMGTKVKNNGDASLGIDYYKRALVHNPKYADAWYNLGVAFAEQGAAITGKALAAARACGQPASSVVKVGVDDALVCYEMAISFNPKCAQAYNNLGVIYKDRGNLEKSIHYYQNALKANPDFAQTLNNMGVIYTMLGKLDEAYSYCRRAISANAEYAEAYNNLGVLYRDEGLIKEAVTSYDQCLKLDPNSRSAGQNRLLAMNSITLDKAAQDIIDVDAEIILMDSEHKASDDVDMTANSSSSSSSSVDQPGDESKQPLTRDRVSELLATRDSLPPPARVLRHVFLAHAAWGKRFKQRYTRFTSWPNSPDPNRIIRIGYISADFFTHSVSYFIEAPLRFANAAHTHVICYANVAREDTKTQRLKKLAQEWRSITNQSSMEVAELVRKDQIDILVDLTGHTAGNRLDVFAHKPAPVQVSWIGYPNTTGLDTIDYRFTDDVADPVDSKQQYVEELVRLPGPAPFLCYTPLHDPPPISDAPVLHNKFITFGSFNNLAKINDTVLKLWAAILLKVEGSRLLMKCKPFACESVRNKMFARLHELGIAERRVDLIPLLPATTDHLRVYNMVDISIDTFPYAGTTTTCEALSMGVPVVTLQSATPFGCHAHNVGATLLSRIPGLEFLVATTAEQYIDTAVKLANDVPRLSAIRRHLRQNMLKSPLCDGKLFTTHLEETYRQLWQRWCKKVGTSGAMSAPSSGT